MCEIDRRVCDVSKEYFAKSMAVGFSDPRLNLVRAALRQRVPPARPPAAHRTPTILPRARSCTWTRPST